MTNSPLSDRVSPQATLLALADRCEKEEPSEALDDKIWRWVNDSQLFFKGWQYDLEFAPKYTTSLDAAVTLVPRPWRTVHAEEYLSQGSWGWTLRRALPEDYAASTGKTAALALCAAALRARAAPQGKATPEEQRQNAVHWNTRSPTNEALD